VSLRIEKLTRHQTVAGFDCGEEPRIGSWSTTPTRSVNLTDELDQFILAKVASGKFENASEVVRAALRALDRDEREYEARLAAVRAAIDEGDASPDAAPGVFERIRAKHGLPLTR